MFHDHPTGLSQDRMSLEGDSTQVLHNTMVIEGGVGLHLPTIVEHILVSLIRVGTELDQLGTDCFAPCQVGLEAGLDLIGDVDTGGYIDGTRIDLAKAPLTKAREVEFDYG